MRLPEYVAPLEFRGWVSGDGEYLLFSNSQGGGYGFWEAGAPMLRGWSQGNYELDSGTYPESVVFLTKEVGDV